MQQLHTLENASRPWKRRRRVGRGIGSGLGKTCGRGVKGAKSRSGWKRRDRFEGGQIPLYRKLPERGFSRGAFQKKLDALNLDQVEGMFNDGDLVSVETLKAKGFMKGLTHGVKLLARGELKKKVRFEVTSISKTAEEKLKSLGLSYTIIE
jgi:large subunit ribosomal protein L15